MIQPHYQSFTHSIKIRNPFKRLPLSRFGSLSISGMQQGDLIRAMFFARNCRANARVHPSTQQHHRFFRPLHLLFFLFFASPRLCARQFFVQTPFVAGCHTNLCSCKPSLTGILSSSIHSTNCRGSSPFHFPSGSSNTGENKTCFTFSFNPCSRVNSRANS